MTLVAALTLDGADEATPWQEAESGFAGQVLFDLAFSTLVGTLTFQGRLVGDTAGTGYTILATRLETDSTATTATSDGLYRVDASGMQVRVKLTAYTSGSVVVKRSMVVG
jgi:hypothetical protein